MANTTNLNLSKLSGTEKLKTFPTPYSDNMDAIDGAFGAGFGVNGKPTVNAEINSLADGLAIISNNNTHAAITAGQFVYVRGHGSLSDGLYVATSNISANGTLSGSNLTADTAGGLNSVYSSLDSKIASTVISSNTLANIESALVTIGNSLTNGDAKDIRFSISTASGLFNARDYVGTIRRRASSRYIVNVWSLDTDDIEGFYNGSTWSWSSLNNTIKNYNTGDKIYLPYIFYPYAGNSSELRYEVNLEKALSNTFTYTPYFTISSVNKYDGTTVTVGDDINITLTYRNAYNLYISISGFTGLTSLALYRIAIGGSRYIAIS